LGTGQGTGSIDLPIAREKSTGLPIVPGSGIKGVLRNRFREDTDEEKKLWEVLFGPEANNLTDENGFAGALNIQDAQLLCLPVRSVFGMFAWVSCPFVLDRYRRDIDFLGTELPPLNANPEGTFVLAANPGTNKVVTPNVFLEDLELSKMDQDDSVDLVAKYIAEAVFPNDPLWQEIFNNRFLVVADSTFSFLAETGTEVRARVKIKPNSRTVETGALWYEENLPAETILWGIIGCDRSRSTTRLTLDGDELMDKFILEMVQGQEIRLQLGGNVTVGRGNVRWIL
jgi:CRISPR-associated protein Cmr4